MQGREPSSALDVPGRSLGMIALPRSSARRPARGMHDRQRAWRKSGAALCVLVVGGLIWSAPALALSQVNRVIGAVRGAESEPPTSLNATLEFDVHAGSIVVRQWPKHPLCSC